MEENSSDHLDHLLVLDAVHKEYLGHIRHWSNLKIATEDGKIWVRNFTLKQIESVEIKSIPYKHIFSVKDNKLFPYGSILPVSKAPSLLWAPIEIGLPVKLPKPNHNYFGIRHTIHAEIIPSPVVHETCALQTTPGLLASFIETAPAVRLQNLSWVILDKTKVLILGMPLLPLQGDTFWKRNSFLLPSGYDFDISLLTEVMEQKLGSQSKWTVWDKNGSYMEINKRSFVQLSISSFRLSVGNSSNSK